MAHADYKEGGTVVLRTRKLLLAFHEGFLHHAKPLFKLTKKDQKWSWGEEQQWAFDEIKDRVMSSPILHFTDDSKPFCIKAGSSNFATGAVLSQQSDDDLKWHLITFYSKSLNAVEGNYDIHNKEMLAVMGVETLP
jgi:RNase H-like domain found in reverse transcriptase